MASLGALLSLGALGVAQRCLSVELGALGAALREGFHDEPPDALEFSVQGRYMCLFGVYVFVFRGFGRRV